MSFPNYEHITKHHRSWDNMDDYLVDAYATEPMPSIFIEAPKHQHGYAVTSDYGSKEHVPKHHGRVRIIEYECEAPPPKVDHRKVYEENVDSEAEEFIKLEHKKFELSKWMSMRAG